MRSAKPLAVAVVILLTLYVAWRVVVNRRVGSDLIAAGRTAVEFTDALRVGDLDTALGLTSTTFAAGIGPKGLEDLLARHPALRNKPDPGAVGLKGRRLENYATRHFMYPRVPVPKNEHDYLPVVVKMSVGNSGRWLVDEIVVYE